ncbi:MAG: tetratricopeptide repeat protein [Legionellaceae bacterium]|nr:tetratricopeptide repeat protein [Legionellaceae bacterium]
MRAFCLAVSWLLAPALYGMSWTDWWSTADQQGQQAMQQGQYRKAQQRFRRPDWQASAAYRAGDYDAAQAHFQQLNSTLGYYNAGNALAHMGQYEKAIEAYKKALEREPDHPDALHNKALLEKLLREQQQQSPSSEQQDKQDKQDNQDKQDKQDKQDTQDIQDKQNTQDSAAAPTPEQQEAQRQRQQLLRMVPDDPGGLLRQKFIRDHLRRQRG